MNSRTSILIIVFLVANTLILKAEEPVGNQIFQGYWLEYEGGGFSFTSLFVFEPSEMGSIDGKVYFFDDESETKEFALGNIKCSGDSLCFFISGSSIFFSGVVDSDGASVKGAFTLNDGTVIPVIHKKVDPEKEITFLIARIGKCGGVMKKEINASSGLEISDLIIPFELIENDLIRTAISITLCFPASLYDQNHCMG